MYMIKINIHEAKANLSRYLKHLGRGETIILCKRNVPIAEIRPLAPERTAKRPLGLARGDFDVPPAFNAPLPDEVLDGFDGHGS
jgi:antitoxin (DNA-binding transcriptional repressor) of toxin-antitoxin stability system